MKQSGRALLPVIVAVIFLGAGILFFFLAGTSPSSVANDFMVALAKGDVKQLAKDSYLEGLSDDQAEKVWSKTIDRGQYYRFEWLIKNSVQPTPDAATVTMDLFRNADAPGGYEENYSLNLVRINGRWRVDVRQIPRGMYPALPR